VSDVARLAGVSAATVSRAFNTPALLVPDTLQRVQRAAQQLGYQPYGLARSLRKRRSMVVGIVMPSLRYAYYAGTLELLQGLLARAGYTVLLSTANHHPQAELDGVRALMAQGVDGVILFGRALHDGSAPLLALRGVPHLRCWSALPEEPSVAFDHGAAMADVVHHLVALGHRRFALVIPFVALADRHRGRLTAVREALAQHGLALPNAALVDDGGLDAPAGRSAWRTLRARGQQASAVICSNDLIAAGVILECQAQGLRVPQQVSVTGYNDSALAGAFEPAITSVDTPVELHAQEVARVLLAALREQQPISAVRLPTQLRVRASTGPAA
jgi:LacI family transcriptional regulator